MRIIPQLGLLAYEAYRVKLYQDYLDQVKKAFRVPKLVHSNDKALDFMYECLQKVGGTYEETQHLADFIKEERERVEKEKDRIEQ